MPWANYRIEKQYLHLCLGFQINKFQNISAFRVPNLNKAIDLCQCWVVYNMYVYMCGNLYGRPFRV